MDPITTVTIGGALYFKEGGNELLVRLLGPTADYLGEESKNIISKQKENVGRIFSKAWNTLGEQINQSGQVPPRVLKQVWDEGRFVEDELTAQYFGGLLASSRSEEERDDRALTYLDIVKSMSNYQIKFHYLIYSLVHHVYKGEKLNCAIENDRNKIKIFIPVSVYEDFMEFSKGENMSAITNHNFFGLKRLDLIGNFYAAGNLEHLRLYSDKVNGDGIIVTASPVGIELYLWINGNPKSNLNDILNEKIQTDSTHNFNISSKKVTKLA